MRALKRKKVTNRVLSAVKDGAEALDFLSPAALPPAGSGTEPARCYCSTSRMPMVDRFEVLQADPSRRRLATMPVVILTSSSEERNITQGYRLPG